MRLQYLNYHQLVRHYREEILSNQEILQELEEKFEKMHGERLLTKRRIYPNTKKIS